MQATINFFGFSHSNFRNPISVLQQNYVVCIADVPNYPHSTAVRLDIQDG
jgi:hypothetical protein